MNANSIVTININIFGSFSWVIIIFLHLLSRGDNESLHDSFAINIKELFIIITIKNNFK
jgi:hypothetical protein